MIQILALLFGLITSPAFAQNTTCANKPAADNSNACANTRFVTSAITAAYPNTWLKSVVGTSQNATATAFAPANQAQYLVGSFTGSGGAPYALTSVADTATGSTAVPALAAQWIAHNINAGAGEGNRFSLMPILTKNVAIAGTDASKKFYTPFFAIHFANAGDGGSAVGPTYYGSYYGIASLLEMRSGAAYLKSAQGAEFDISMQTGSSAQYKSGLLIASVNSDAVKGATYEAMLSFGRDSTTTATWDRGIDFNWPLGLFPFSTSATLIGSSSGGTVDKGVDLSALTITTSAFKSTGYNITGSGAATVASLASSGAVSGTTGNFSSTLSASTITSTGAASAFVMASRTGSGTSYLWYNPSGAGIRLSDGGSDIVTVDSAGAIVSSSNVTGIHHYSTVSVPTASACGGSPAVDAGSSAHAGKITFGSATTACTLTFASAFANNAFCTVTPGAQPAAVANIPYISAQSKTAFTISGGTASAVYYYNCGGN
jgi:hypothetical protein